MSAEEKTFEPTQRHRKKMREQGETALSRDLVSASMLLAGMLLFWGFGNFLAGVPIQGAEKTWSEAPLLRMTPEQFLQIWNSWVQTALFLIVPLLALIPATTALVTLLQTQFLFLPSRLTPDWKNLNPGKGLARIFSLDSLVNAGFGLAKLFFVAVFAAWMISRQLPVLCSLCQMEFQTAVQQMQSIVLGTGLQIAAVLFCLALADYGWQFFRHQQRLKMSYEQMKEEIRITEGDASVKQKMRQNQKK